MGLEVNLEVKNPPYVAYEGFFSFSVGRQGIITLLAINQLSCNLEVICSKLTETVLKIW